MIHFLRVIPNSDSDLDIATREFIKIASETPPVSDFTFRDAMEQALIGECFIYTAMDDKPLFSMVLKPYETTSGKTLNVVLIGGGDVKPWKKQTKEHVVKIMKSVGAKNLCIVGRMAWARVFPELKEIGTIFVYDPDNDNSQKEN